MAPHLARALDLEAHPEGGWFRQTWRGSGTVRPSGYPGERPTATAILYVLGPGEESVWHRVRSDELWLWHRGATLALWLGGDGERPDEDTAPVRLGPRVEDGEVCQLLVPGGWWQRARPVEHGGGHGPGSSDGSDGGTLVSCVVSPGFSYEDFTTLG